MVDNARSTDRPIAWPGDKPEARTSSRSSWSISLPALLTALILASIAPLAAAGVAISVWYKQLARETQEAGLLYTSRSISSAVDNEIEKYMALAETLTRSPALASDDLKTFEAEARRIFGSPGEGWLILASAEGQELVNTSFERGAALPRRTEDGFRQQQRVAQTGKHAVSSVFPSRTGRGFAVMVDIPVKPGGGKYGLAIAIPTGNFAAFLNPPDRHSEWVAGVMDQEGRFVARLPRGESLVGELASPGWRAVARREGIANVVTREGDKVVNANANTALAEWTVGVAALESQIEASARPIAIWGIGGALLAVGLSFALAFAIYRYLLQALIGLRRATAAALNGPAPDFHSPIAEFDQLWRGLREATEQKRAAELELAASESRFRRAAEAARFGVYQLAPATGAMSWSGDIAEIFGVDGPIENMQSLMAAFHPDDREKSLKRIRQIRRQVGPYELEFRIQRKDGSIRWILDRGESVGPLDSGGRVAQMTGTFIDITERKLVEERNRMLMREVNHRSKNLLTVISVIARRTQSGSASEFVKAFTARINGLAANQDLLVASEWRGAALRPLIVAHLQPFGEAVQFRLALNGPDIILGPEAAQNLGMALHELATNASKYGALSRDEGRVTIDWSIVDGAFSLTWTEQGGPAVAPPDRRGFGSTVLTTLVATALAGESAFEFKPEGLVWILKCPAARLAPAPSELDAAD